MFRKIILTALSFAFAFSATAANNPVYKRVLTTVHDRIASPFNPLDPNHGQMIGTGLYTQAQAHAFDQQVLDEAYLQFGLNFRAGVYDPATGNYVLPGVAIMIPYIDGLEEDIAIVTDSKYPNRAKQGDWFVLQAGRGVVFLGDGVFPGGLNAGANYRANDNWVMVEYNLLRKNSNWKKDKNREVFVAKSYELGRNVLSQWDKSQLILSVDLTDCSGDVGIGSNATTVVRRPQNASGEFILRSMDTFTWE